MGTSKEATLSDFKLWNVLLDNVNGCFREIVPDVPTSSKDPIKMKPHCPFSVHHKREISKFLA